LQARFLELKLSRHLWTVHGRSPSFTVGDSPIPRVDSMPLAPPAIATCAEWCDVRSKPRA
jgi:hypothetical protein